MGSRGSTSASAKQSHSAIGNAQPIEVRNEKSASGGNRWKQMTLDAQESSDGTLEVGYSRAARYENPNRNTTYAYHELKAGFYTEAGNRSIQTHNIDLSKVNVIKGKTFDLKNFLKSEGFTWSSTDKLWKR